MTQEGWQENQGSPALDKYWIQIKCHYLVYLGEKCFPIVYLSPYSPKTLFMEVYRPKDVYVVGY